MKNSDSSISQTIVAISFHRLRIREIVPRSFITFLFECLMGMHFTGKVPGPNCERKKITAAVARKVTGEQRESVGRKGENLIKSGSVP